jgi:hypothetical protein
MLDTHVHGLPSVTHGEVGNPFPIIEAVHLQSVKGCSYHHPLIEAAHPSTTVQFQSPLEVYSLFALPWILILSQSSTEGCSSV